MSYQQVPQGKDPQLWALAQRRASFKSHFTTYVILSVFFWVLWYLSGSRTHNSGLPWPVWPMLGWGIGIAFHYISAYVTPGSNTAEREYEKLVKDQQTSSNL